MYKSDRSFTDFVHTNLALPIIYKQLAWREKKIDAELLKSVDMQQGIDYIFENEQGKVIKVQERFRDDYYKTYRDCTLRYKREHNPNESRRISEFFKIKADYLVYGITNGKKFPEKRHTLTGFLKFVVLDLNVLFKQIETGNIVLKKGRRTSYIQSGKLISPINENHDKSSNFVAFDIFMLNKLFKSENIILLQNGFLP